MKKVSLLFALLAVLFSASQSFAQVTFGAKAGLNLANMTGDDNDDAKMKIGFHVGGTAEFGLSDATAVEVGLLYSAKGFKMSSEGVDVTYNANYLEVPINFVYKLEMGDNKFLINAGPYLGYAISGKIKGEGSEQGVTISYEEDITFGSGDEDMQKALDYGLNVGVGFQLNKIVIGAQYGLGLANLANSDGTAKNAVIGVSVGYKF